MIITCKPLVIFLIICLAFSQYACRTNTPSQVGNAPKIQKAEVPEEFRLKLSPDSGYINANDALCFLLNNRLVDTAGGTSLENHIRYQYTFELFEDFHTGQYKYLYNEPNDTIGKYYALTKSGDYIAAIALSTDILLLELGSQGELINYHFYGYRDYSCCWNGIDDVLRKYESYFGFISCNAKSTFCSSYVTLFKDELVLYDNCIPLFEFSEAKGDNTPGHALRSSMKIKGDQLLMRYSLEKFIEDDLGNRKIISTEKFTVSYVYRNHRFETEEEHKFDKVKL